MGDLKIESLTKHYEDKMVVDHINMKVPQGKLIAFLGPNGAGKSTTVGMLTGLIEPDDGTIELDHLCPNQITYRQKIGVVFQNSVLDPQLTVAQNLRLRTQMYPHVSANWVTQLMMAFELNEFQTRTYGTLSGGQRRRVDIVRALVPHPELLILDEPSTGLDIQTRMMIWETLKRMQQDQHLTLMLTTHYLEEAEMADFIYVIDHGKIIAADTLDQLKQTYSKYHLAFHVLDPIAFAKQLEQKAQPFRQINDKFNLEVTDARTCIAFLQQYRDQITAFDCRQSNMNDIFMALTGRKIR